MNGIPFSRLVDQYTRELRSLFHASAILTREGLMDLATSQKFRKAAENVARRMVAEVGVTNARSWREAAFRSTRSREIFKALEHEFSPGTQAGNALDKLTIQNAKLIRSIPLDIARHITRIARQEQARGSRAKEIAETIREIAPQLTLNKIKLIARTEISRAETSVTRVRSESIGADYYQWMTSADQRVRKSHQNLNKVLVAWDDPPQPEELVHEKSTLGAGAPGTFPNCRCLALPLISLDEVSWPCRVFRNGRITTMTRAAFIRISGWELAA